MWYKGNFYKYGFGLLLILVNIYFLGKVDFFLLPLRSVIATIFFPILISGVLYYLLSPLVNLAVKLKIPRTPAILLVFAVLLVIIYYICASAGSVLTYQVNQLFSNLPRYLNLSIEKTVEFFNSSSLSFLPLDQIQQQLTGLLGKIVPYLSQGILSGISTVANITVVIVITPFILFYLLKDDHIFHKYMLGFIPKKYRDNGDEILDDINRTISSYIVGQAIIALVTGILMYIGYLILGLNFSLLLGLFALVTAIIPILGAFIGIIPAVLVALTIDPIMALKVLILMIIVQQLTGNLLAPQIMGRRLNIHPLTFIIIVMTAASVYGFIGMLIAVPVYAVLKIIGKKVYELYKLDKSRS